MQPPATLSDGVVVLREIREGDRAVVLSTMRDSLVAEWLNMPVEVTDAAFDALLRVAQDGRARRHRDNFELAYLARDAGRGRGLMTRAVRLLCDWLFDEGVGRLAERCGFVREGVERRSIWLHGRREDAVIWSLLPDDPR